MAAAIPFRYAGRRLAAGGRLAHSYVVDVPAGRRLLEPVPADVLLSKPFGRPAIGDRVLLEQVADRRYKLVDPDPAAPVDERRASWAAEDAAAYQASQAAALERRLVADAKSSIDSLTLLELERLMRRLPAPQRSALIAVVLRRLGA